MHYALVVYKTPEALDKLSESRFLQKKINAHAKRTIGFAANPFLTGEEKLIPQNDSDDSDMDEEERAKRKEDEDHRKKMEALGFTVVTAGLNKYRTRGVDDYGTVVEGVSAEEMQRLHDK